MEYIWNDTKRILGQPISFTHYSLTEDRLFVRSGLLKTEESQNELFHVNDIQVSQGIWQKIFGVGDVKVFGYDTTDRCLILKNVKDPFGVREIIYHQVEMAKKNKGMQYTEYASAAGHRG